MATVLKRAEKALAAAQRRATRAGLHEELQRARAACVGAAGDPVKQAAAQAHCAQVEFKIAVSSQRSTARSRRKAEKRAENAQRRAQREVAKRKVADARAALSKATSQKARMQARVKLREAELQVASNSVRGG